MCILFLHTDNSAPPSKFRLILASNRDEYFRRPALQAHIWDENSSVIGGQDMEPGREGGTWLAMSKKGRIGILLNVTGENIKDSSSYHGRGFLVSDYVTNKHNLSQKDYLKELSESRSKYSPFSFISINISSENIDVQQFSNASGCKNHAERVGSGSRGWGNSVFDHPYQKVIAGTSCFKNVVETYGSTDTKEILVQELLSLLKLDKSHFPDPELQKRLKNMNPSIMEKSSCIFITVPERGYGTRTHTIILIDGQGNIDFMEWTMKEPIDSNNPTWLYYKHSCKLENAIML